MWLSKAKLPHERECGAKTRNGTPCKRAAMPNGRCNLHGGKSTGPPKGNKNAVTTGEHETIWMDTLDVDERVLFESIRTDPLEQINHDIKICEIRIRRMLMLIQDIKAGKESNSTDRKFQRIEDKKGRKRMIEVEQTVREQSKMERILKIEDALTRVQDKKTKLLELKHKFLVDEVPDEEEEDDGFMDALAGKVSEVWGDGSDSSET
ncbi:HGGxSTG domain-containing protein [Paenibacillus sp. GCM10012303]|uniref:HGGxSTG domain-containing protein n=1 Tax=Paenibacillus sp. GCM10012303 TaxID=3317340 RepID=UPI00361719E7